MSKLLLPFAFLMAVAVACGGGGPVDLTDRDITDEELALMVLPQSELGPDYADFQRDEDQSGLKSNEQTIKDAFDPEDESSDVDQFGRLNGYGDEYSSLEALTDGQGVFLIATDVDLFEGPDGASGDFRDTIDDAKRQVGETSEGVTFESAEEFVVSEIADESAGYVFRATATGDQNKITLQGTTVGLRRGRIIGSAIIVRLDDQDVGEEVTALARKLDERIQAVLRGDVQAEPAAEPKPTAKPEPTAELAPTSESAQEPSAEVSPSDFLDSFRFTAQMAAEAEDGGFALDVEGEFVAPDRLRCTMSISLNDATLGQEELVVVGDDAWIDTGGGFEATTADDPDVLDDVDVCPGSPVFWEGLDFIKDPGPLQGEPDTKNGVEATLYSLADAAEALQAIGFLPSELEGVTVNTFDVWLAEDGDWPVALDMDFSAEGEAAAGAFGLSPGEEGPQQARITVRVDITNVNDEDVHVEPPVP
jgi:hypothetical protein